MADDCKNRGKKRSKAHYLNCAKKGHHKPSMEVGQKGFLITCNNREKDCTRETYHLLNKYADKLYGPEESNEINKEDGDVDIEEEVKREVENLKKSLKNERRFQAVNSGARNCIFITAKVPDPCHLIHEMLTDIQTTQKPCSRYVLRVTPVLSVCRANLDDIKSCAEKVFPQYFKETGSTGKTYAFIIKVRNNATLSRDDIIPALGSIIFRLNPSNKADLTTPNLAVLVDIIGKCCCLGIAEDYYKLKKYNVAELTVKEMPSSIKSESDKIQQNDKDTVIDESETPKKMTDKSDEPIKTSTDEFEPLKRTVTDEPESPKKTVPNNDEGNTEV